MNDTDMFGEYQRPSIPYWHEQGQKPSPSAFYGNAATQQASAQSQRLPRVQPRNTPPRMPKPVALALLRRVKRGIVIVSLLGFGTFSALVMGHTVGTTTQQATAAVTVTHKTTATTSTVKKAATTIPVITATKKVTIAPTATPAQQGGGYGFGSSSSTSKPVSGTHTS